MKKVILIALLAGLTAPNLVLAQYKNDGWDHDSKRHHKEIDADQLAGIGFGAAALLGLAGYLILRKRTASA